MVSGELLVSLLAQITLGCQENSWEGRNPSVSVALGLLDDESSGKSNALSRASSQRGRGRDTGCAGAPRTDPDVRHYRIRLLPQVVTTWRNVG